MIAVPQTLEEAIAIIQQLVARIEKLEAENAALRNKVAELETKLARYEGAPPPDPSTPSGMTPPWLKPGKKKKRKKPGRKKGHQGARRASAEPNNHEHHGLDRCPDCGTGLRDRPATTRTRITEDLPPKGEPEVTAHTIESKWCPRRSSRLKHREATVFTICFTSSSSSSGAGWKTLVRALKTPSRARE